MSTDQQLRDRLLAGLRSKELLRDDRVADALATVPRHLFLPGVEPEEAYADEAVVTKRDAAGQPVSSASQPAIVALMLEQLDVRPGQRVLEIGAGTGYNAALLAHLAGPSGHVTTVDLDEDIVAEAREHLAAAGGGPVEVVQADGGLGWAPGAPYDRIILTVGAPDIMPGWATQLAAGGRLVLPLSLRAGLQYAVAFDQAGDHLDSVSVLPCGFMRLRGAFAGEQPPPLSDAERADLFAEPGEPLATGEAITVPELFGGLGAWLTIHEPGLRWLPVDSARVVARSPEAVPHAPERHPTAVLLGEAGCAALTRMGGVSEDATPGRGVPFDLGVRPYGKNGVALAARLAGHVRDWTAAGRPDCGRLQISAWPAGAARPAAPGAAVIDKTHTSLVLSWWPAGPPGAGRQPA
jgi:protein-L-isoaspartate(D-aspartate) O-methyltransferase